jgi:RimJ/RimL family protein N-acetyltransferase
VELADFLGFILNRQPHYPRLTGHSFLSFESPFGPENKKRGPKMNDFVIRQLTPSDWQAFKAVRLKALKDHPAVYTSNYAEDSVKPDAYWISMLDGKNEAVFGIDDQDRLIGLAGIFPSRHEPAGKVAFLGMDYIDANYRGRGLSRLLYQARIDWAKKQDKFVRLIIAHAKGNEASRRANQAFGFTYTHTEMTQFGAGIVEELKYELRLMP